MVKALFDTNILVDYLNAVPETRTELQRYTEKAVSIITWTEVMVGASHDLEIATRNFLSGFDVIAVDEQIAERAVSPHPYVHHIDPWFPRHQRFGDTMLRKRQRRLVERFEYELA